MQRYRRLATELTNYCNFKCRFCPHAYYKEDVTPVGNVFNRKKGFMSRELFARCLDWAEDNCGNVGVGFFGEPMMHPNFIEMMQMLPRPRSYVFTVNSNWSLFTRRHVDALRRTDQVIISLDSINPATFDALCEGSDILDLEGRKRKDRYQAMMEKVDYWLALEDRPPTRITVVVSSFNLGEEEEYRKRWRPKLRQEQDHILFKSVISYGGVVHDDYMSDNACATANDPWIVVGWDGSVSPCNLDVNLEMAVGNLNDNELTALLRGPDWQERLEQIRRKEGICANCFDGNNWSKNKRVFRIKPGTSGAPG